jgi:diguanylate cyclase (GGDEF)-like protein
VGDAVLRELAQLLRQQLRGADLLARWGGEEFLLAFGQLQASACERLLQRLREAVRQHDWSRFAPGLAVTVSVGCRHRAPRGDWGAQLTEADEALYEAKRSGRDRVVLRPE